MLLSGFTSTATKIEFFLSIFNNSFNFSILTYLLDFFIINYKSNKLWWVRMINYKI